jgi:hypothetical protein
MTKQQLIDAIAEEISKPKADIENTLEVLTKKIGDAWHPEIELNCEVSVLSREEKRKPVWAGIRGPAKQFRSPRNVRLLSKREKS